MRLQILTTAIILCVFSALTPCTRATAQDTLPKFQVINAKGRIIVAFYNPYVSALQVNVERSYDSAKNFTTIYALSEPRPGVYTYNDAKAPTVRMYYRVFIQLQSGYSFTHADTPVIFIAPPPAIKKIEEAAPAGPASITLSPRKKPEWEPSTHIFTDDYGNVKVELPPPGAKKYLIKFYDDQQHFLFDMQDIKDLPLTIDKSNFLHAGWFNFELYVDGVLQEKNKFLLSKDN
ncbi:hypothetical protein [Dinghuibacter silviterrae]|uniref:Uncharacterized protein n=1 Tax=Dinghuibacter silviterrae TaxID=1539049 RepID=A0A4R8DGJ9_9BACT|nr:hypothetical protein [Dinghuibacter silviterrae]TDW96508.1 hypothetical protein EDB95_4339 [Dinghuibacter silviterrae]